MFGEKKYVGVALDSNAFKIAQVEATKTGVKLIRLDEFSLVEPADPNKEHVFQEQNSYAGYGQEQENSEQVFGFEEESPAEEQKKTEVDFAELEASAEGEDAFEIGNIDEENKPNTNYLLLYNILSDISRKQVDLGLNIPAGNTIYQIIDNNFKDIKEKQIVESVEDKLEAIYGEIKSTDFYSYEVRDDGSLMLASVDESPHMIHIVDETKEFYRGTLKIKEVYPDEVALIGLYRSNYNPDPTEITALVQFEEQNCRIIFMQGNDVYLLPPPIGQGTSTSNFLNVVFSKILFQLDSGEVPKLNKIVIANNSIGQKAIEFYRENFSDVVVENFQFDDTFLDKGKFDEDTVRPFTTAIALGAAALQKDEHYPKLSMIPEYVVERQKIFKLEWHGIALLVLIFLTFPVANYFYQQNAAEIENLSTELDRTNQQIEQIKPIVAETNEISQNLQLLTSKLALLDSLSQDSRAWSAKTDLLDQEMSRIPNTWLTSLSQSQDGAFLEGYTLYRNRIPAVVDIFEQATLLNVNTEITREKEIYKFSMIVQRFSADTTIYSPEKPTSIEQILNH